MPPGMVKLSTIRTGVSPAHFTFTGRGAINSRSLYFNYAFTTQESPLTFPTLTMWYLSSFSSPRVPSLSDAQRPDRVELVNIALNLASSSSGEDVGFAADGDVLEEAEGLVGFVSCAGENAREKAATRTMRVLFIRI